MPKVEITQLELEAAELNLQEARDEFWRELEKHPDAMRLYVRLVGSQNRLTNAQKARREAEIKEGGSHG